MLSASPSARLWQPIQFNPTQHSKLTFNLVANRRNPMIRGGEKAMNDISIKQVEPQMLNLLRARTLTYRRAKNFQAIGLVFTLGFPLLGITASVFIPTLKPFVAFCALTFGFLEVLFFDRWHKARLRTAAKLQEDFDCTVLCMDWNSFLVGSRVDPEDVFADARKKLRNRK